MVSCPPSPRFRLCVTRADPSRVAPTITGSRSSIPRMQRDMLLQAGLGAWNVHFRKEMCWGLGHGLLVPTNVTYLYRVLFQGPTGSVRGLGQAISRHLSRLSGVPPRCASQVCPPGPGKCRCGASGLVSSGLSDNIASISTTFTPHWALAAACSEWEVLVSLQSSGCDALW